MVSVYDLVEMDSIDIQDSLKQFKIEFEISSNDEEKLVLFYDGHQFLICSILVGGLYTPEACGRWAAGCDRLHICFPDMCLFPKEIKLCVDLAKRLQDKYIFVVRSKANCPQEYL